MIYLWLIVFDANHRNVQFLQQLQEALSGHVDLGITNYEFSL